MKYFLNFLNKHLPTGHSALRIIKNGRFEFLPPRITYALGDLHRRLLPHVDFRKGFYFEVGANNGLELSNTAYLEKYLGWEGILVEAVPHKFVECSKNRPRAHVVHAALASVAGPGDYTRIYYSNLMSVTALPTVVDRSKHIEGGRAYLGSDTKLSGQEFLAPLKTVMQVLEEHGQPHIDFFSLDVEGAEMEVLRGIDFQTCRPTLFLIEARDKEEISMFMNSVNYEYVDQLSHHDYLFRDKTQKLRR
jgi:FkbM family methyltransferase